MINKILFTAVIAALFAPSIIVESYKSQPGAIDIEVDLEETFPDIWVTYHCNAIQNPNNFYKVIQTSTHEYKVNYGFFRLQRGKKPITCI